MSLSRNFNKLDGILHLILGSLGQFFLTKINFSKFFVCKRQLLRLIKIPTKKKSFLFLLMIQQSPKSIELKIQLYKEPLPHVFATIKEDI
jgi:hypothetical protein